MTKPKLVKTNNGKRGGLLKGDKHSDPSGGITAVVTDDNKRPVLLEKDEAIINAAAVKKHHKALSRINQSTGGRPIQDPTSLKSGGNVKTSNQKHMEDTENNFFTESAPEPRAYTDNTAHDKDCYDEGGLIEAVNELTEEERNRVYLIREGLIEEGDRESDFIVEGTRIHSISGDKHVAWEVIGFKCGIILLKHEPHSVLDDVRPRKEITFEQLKQMFENRTISIGGIQEGDTQALNQCIKAIKQCIEKIYLTEKTK